MILVVSTTCAAVYAANCKWGCVQECKGSCFPFAGMEKETAQKEYIALVKRLAEKYAK